MSTQPHREVLADDPESDSWLIDVELTSRSSELASRKTRFAEAEMVAAISRAASIRRRLRKPGFCATALPMTCCECVYVSDVAQELRLEEYPPPRLWLQPELPQFSAPFAAQLVARAMQHVGPPAAQSASPRRLHSAG